VRRGETIVDAELRIRPPDATEIVVQGSTTPVATEDGIRLGAVWTFRDVTEQLEFEARKFERIATASHELRTPLTVIKGQAQYLAAHLDRAGPAALETILPRLETIDQTATMMTTMANQLLEFTRGNLAQAGEPAAYPTAHSPRRCQELEAVGQVAGVLAQELTLDRVAAVVAEQSQRLFNAAAVSVWLADLPREELHLIALRSEPKASAETMGELRVLPFASASFSAVAARTGKPVEVRDMLTAGPAYATSRRRTLRDGLRSAFCQPLFAKGRLVGVIAILYAAPHAFLEQERALIRALGDLWAVAIDNARLYHDAQEAARSANESLALLDTLQETAPIGFAFVDRNLRFVRINQAMAATNGVPMHQAIGRTIQEVIPTIAAQENECVREVLGTGRPILNRELRGETPAAPGVTRDWLASYYPVRLPNGNLLGVGIVVTEITERKRREEKLTERLAREQAALTEEETERARLRAVLEQLPEGIILFDDQGHLVFWNRAAGALAVAAKEPADPFGNPPIFDVRLPSGEPFPFDELPATRAIRHGETVRGVEALLRQEDGDLVPTQIGAAPVYCLRGERFGTVVASHDISALKALEREREEWISIVTHDLRQPVTIILGYAGLLANKLAPHATPDERKAIEYILTSTQNLNKMITDLLDVSRIEARRLKIEPLPVDLRDLVRKAIERTATLTQGHTLRVEIRGRIPPISVDPTRIEQVLGNLLSNAAKYGYANSEIQVTLERRIDELVVGVMNQGDGIPSDELPKLFSRFHRARQATTKRIAGLGLGLYITKGLVEAHGGRIWVESVPRRTTSFRFSLPIRPAS
jgi:PAS domain S-box-containing protein